MFEQTFKNIDDILHKDAGCSSELDYVEQTSWIRSSLFIPVKVNMKHRSVHNSFIFLPIPNPSAFAASKR